MGGGGVSGGQAHTHTHPHLTRTLGRQGGHGFGIQPTSAARMRWPVWVHFYKWKGAMATEEDGRMHHTGWVDMPQGDMLMLMVMVMLNGRSRRESGGSKGGQGSREADKAGAATAALCGMLEQFGGMLERLMAQLPHFKGNG